MKFKVIKNWFEQYTVQVTHGHQSFRLDYQGSKKECLWYARMFRLALKNAYGEKS